MFKDINSIEEIGEIIDNDDDIDYEPYKKLGDNMRNYILKINI
jgi:hypothetical protein